MSSHEQQGSGPVRPGQSRNDHPGNGLHSHAVPALGLAAVAAEGSGFDLFDTIATLASTVNDMVGPAGWATLIGTGVAGGAAITGTAYLQRTYFPGQENWTGTKADRGAPGWDTGMATPSELKTKLGATIARKQYERILPHLAGTLKKEPPTRYARPLVDYGTQRLWAPMEESIAILAPQRRGKSGLMASMLLDAPGAAVMTGVRTDLYLHTHALRERVGPISFFNPDGLGGLLSTLGWTPVLGCADPMTAYRRAGDVLLAGVTGGVVNSDFWESNAARVLRAYLHAAALGERTIHHVADWANSPDNGEPLRILQRAQDAADGWAEDLESLMKSKATATAGSIWTTLQNVLSFMRNPQVAAAMTPVPGREFDPAAFIRDKGTLYLLGEERSAAQGSVAPLVTGLMMEIHRVATQMAQDSPGQRLDPSLLYGLDEVANICPIPLSKWISKSGALWITVVAALQSYGQLVERWGQDAATTIWDNATIKLIFGGFSDPGFLRRVSEMCGQTDVPTMVAVASGSQHGQRREVGTPRRVDRIPPEQIREIPDWKALLVHGNTRPVVGRVQPVWKRRDYKAFKRAQKKTGTAPAPAPVPAVETEAAE